MLNMITNNILLSCVIYLLFYYIFSILFYYSIFIIIKGASNKIGVAYIFEKLIIFKRKLMQIV